jgi:hypothetical protein
MYASVAKSSQCGRSAEPLAAELAEAVVPVALQYGVGDQWLDLELDLWHVLAQTIERWCGASSSADSAKASQVARTELLAALAGAAYRTTLRHSTRASVPQAEPGLYCAFRLVMQDTVQARRRPLV